MIVHRLGLGLRWSVRTISNELLVNMHLILLVTHLLLSLLVVVCSVILLVLLLAVETGDALGHAARNGDLARGLDPLLI